MFECIGMRTGLASPQHGGQHPLQHQLSHRGPAGMPDPGLPPMSDDFGDLDSMLAPDAFLEKLERPQEPERVPHLTPGHGLTG